MFLVTLEDGREKSNASRFHQTAIFILLPEYSMKMSKILYEACVVSVSRTFWAKHFSTPIALLPVFARRRTTTPSTLLIGGR